MTLTTARDEARELQAWVAAAAARHQVPGVAVGILDGGVETYVCHGVTSVENPLAIDEDTLFQFGSTGKTLTATALLRLADEGKVELDAPVRKYLPDFKVADESVAAKVTVLQLLNHTAGWRGDYFLDTGRGDDALEKFVASMADLPQTHPLGERASYNNAAVCVAGRVIEVVTGTTFEKAIHDLVLAPLGLDHTFYLEGEAITRRTVVGHFSNDEGPAVVRPWGMPRSGAPAGGAFASIRDQIAYARFHLGDGTAPDGTKILNPETLRRMQEPTAKLEEGSALGEAVGISWLLSTVGGAKIVAHGGTTIGQLSAFDMVPERDFAFAILTNASNGGKLHTELSEWILENYLGIADEVVEPVALEPGQLEEYAGTYNQGGILTHVTVEDDHLLFSVEVTPEALAELEKSLGVVPPMPKPMPLAVAAGDQVIPHGESARRAAGKFVRNADGSIVGLDSGGRLAPKI